jgi:hypothetical protein
MTGKTVRRDQRKIVAEKTQATETKKTGYSHNLTPTPP